MNIMIGINEYDDPLYDLICILMYIFIKNTCNYRKGA